MRYQMKAGTQFQLQNVKVQRTGLFDFLTRVALIRKCK